jgi:hypothetical protein
MVIDMMVMPIKVGSAKIESLPVVNFLSVRLKC